nr:MAG TPA: upper collar protein [Caudoviricetes sp.]
MGENKMIDNDRLGVELSRDLSRKVIEHRDKFYDFFIGRYMEGLANLFYYSIKPFDKATLEIALREGYGVAVGVNKFGQLGILGYINNNQFAYNRPDLLLKPKRYTGSMINYTMPSDLLPERAKTKQFLEIWNWDNGQTGDFVVFWNKQINLTNDFQIIQHYAEELAEIVASRFSLIIQAKIQTVLTGDPGDETINQMISAIYNGNPFVKLGKTFDIEDHLITINNADLANNLAQLKTEYQNKIAELNALFGINVLAVDKESGVTASEANGNLGYVTMNGNVWLESRQKALDLLNARFNKKYTVSIDKDAVGMLGMNQNEDNNNPFRSDN